MKALVKTTLAETEHDTTPAESSRKFWKERTECSDENGDIPKVIYPTTTTTSDHERHNKQVVSNDTPNQRRQTRVLLVSLIESLCKTYGGTPDQTRNMFFSICQTLRTLGFIDSEFYDDVASIRFTYHKAFEHIFYAAAQTVQQEQQGKLPLKNPPKLLTSVEQQQEFIKEHIQSLTGEQDASSFFPYVNDDKLIPLKYALNHIQHSRYQNDFIEVGMLGRGGFASAYKVRNKLDDVEYAIKKIQLFNEKEDDNTDHDKILREIKNLARLEHHNVVRYYSSWLEYANEMEHAPSDQEDLSFLSASSSQSSVFHGNDPTFDDDIHFQSTTVDEMSFISFGHDSSSSTEEYVQPSTSNSTVKKSSFSGGFILFIQMQLCPSTLHEYIKYRNRNTDVYFDEQQNIELFSQILEGAAYIHGEGLIHRDLKPSNIFLSRPAGNVLDYRLRHRECKHHCGSTTEALIPKIGDFGLAARVLPHMPSEELYAELHHPSSSSNMIELFTTAASMSSSSSYAQKSSIESDMQLLTTRTNNRPKLKRNITSGVGTRTYAAPEQLAIPSLPYDEKADIYSLGIILFELYQPFSTAMERADSIDQLKKGIFPKGFIETYPTQTDIIRSMMSLDPRSRPSALDLLDLDLFQPYRQQDQSSSAEPSPDLSVLHHQEMEAMRIQYDKMKHANEDLQRRLDELQSKLDGCGIDKKRHHPEECSAHHESKKLNTLDHSLPMVSSSVNEII